MQAISNRCYPTAKNQLFFILQLHLLEVIVQHPERWPGAEDGKSRPTETAPWVHNDLSLHAVTVTTTNWEVPQPLCF